MSQVQPEGIPDPRKVEPLQALLGVQESLRRKNEKIAAPEMKKKKKNKVLCLGFCRGSRSSSSSSNNTTNGGKRGRQLIWLSMRFRFVGSDRPPSTKEKIIGEQNQIEIVTACVLRII